MKTIIKANQPWWKINLKELLDYKDLLFLLVFRDLTAIYKQTVLGPVWFILQPLITTLVFTVIFGNLAGIDTEGVPHFIFYMSGTILWNYFQNCLVQSSSSLISNASILKKVYCPRLIIPLSMVVGNLANFVLNFVMFLSFYLFYLFFTKATLQPHWSIALLPVTILQCAMLGLGVGLWGAGLTTRYKDISFAIPFLTQLWMYATPIVWPVSLVPPPWQWVVWLNPMAFIIEFNRYAFTGSGTVSVFGASVSWSLTILLLVTGVFVFNRAQRTFVDTI